MKKLFIGLLLTSILISCNNQKKETPKTETQPIIEKQTKPSFDKTVYQKKGKEIAMATFKVFKGHIQKVASTQGLPAVVDFCNKKALQLTDSMAQANNVIIKRTSHKLRNEKNAPDAAQKEILDTYLKAQEEGQALKPIVKKDKDGYVHFYGPIKLKHECLKCHGQPEKDISPAIYKVIKEKYPNDQATGFKEGDLRGIWDIKFLEKK